MNEKSLKERAKEKAEKVKDWVIENRGYVCFVVGATAMAIADAAYKNYCNDKYKPVKHKDSIGWNELPDGDPNEYVIDHDLYDKDGNYVKTTRVGYEKTAWLDAIKQMQESIEEREAWLAKQGKTEESSEG